MEAVWTFVLCHANCFDYIGCMFKAFCAGSEKTSQLIWYCLVLDGWTVADGLLCGLSGVGWVVVVWGLG
jgi:hypothetical protein